MSPLHRLAFIGNSLPRRCGIATFTTDLQQAIATSRPTLETAIVAMTDHGQVYDYPAAVQLQIHDDRTEDYVQAANFLNARLSGRSLGELRRIVADEISANRTELDTLSAHVVEAGLATWTGEGRPGSLIVRGQARLLSDVTQIERLTSIQALFERLEAQETMLRLLELAEQSEGVRIFIGAESGLFGTSGVSMVVAPARNDGGRIVGAIGVIGPTRINYGRIIPVVDYTARVIGRLLG